MWRYFVYKIPCCKSFIALFFRHFSAMTRSNFFQLSFILSCCSLRIFNYLFSSRLNFAALILHLWVLAGRNIVNFPRRKRHVVEVCMHKCPAVSMWMAQRLMTQISGTNFFFRFWRVHMKRFGNLLKMSYPSRIIWDSLKVQWLTCLRELWMWLRRDSPYQLPDPIHQITWADIVAEVAIFRSF